MSSACVAQVASPTVNLLTRGANANGYTAEVAPPGPVSPLAIITVEKPRDLSHRCWAKTVAPEECKVRVKPVLTQSLLYLSFLGGMSVAKDPGLRHQVIDAIENGQFWQRWIDSASNYWFAHWDQSSPWKDTYVGHPMFGVVTNYVWIQNDPYGETMQWDNSKEYWKSRLRALPLTTLLSFEWKLGPISEASLGNSGYGPNKGIYWEPKYRRWANDTGLGPLVTTPIGGFLWTWGEDVVDRYLMPKLEAKSKNPLYLLLISVATPARSSANLLRLKAPWYRPYRHVKARW